jgi:hypothetical protein
MSPTVARQHGIPAATGSTTEAVESDIRSLRAETDRIIRCENLTPESLALYDLRRQAIFNRLRSYLRAGDGAAKHHLKSLVTDLLEQDCLLLQKLQGNISGCAKGFFRLRPRRPLP